MCHIEIEFSCKSTMIHVPILDVYHLGVLKLSNDYQIRCRDQLSYPVCEVLPLLSNGNICQKSFFSTENLHVTKKGRKCD